MSIDHDPGSLRNTIRMALGESWTKDLEDKLFWPLSSFSSASFESGRKLEQERIREALSILKPDV